MFCDKRRGVYSPFCVWCVGVELSCVFILMIFVLFCVFFLCFVFFLFCVFVLFCCFVLCCGFVLCCAFVLCCISILVHSVHNIVHGNKEGDMIK